MEASNPLNLNKPDELLEYKIKQILYEQEEIAKRKRIETMLKIIEREQSCCTKLKLRIRYFFIWLLHKE